MSRTNPQAFNPRIVLGLVLFGVLAFIATLYFIGTGNTGREVNDGAAHGAGRGLTGYAALAQLLEKDGYEVTRSRSPGSFEDYNLLVLTPPANADPDQINQIISDRQYVGPTIVILPKWLAFPAPPIPGTDVKDGWVRLVGATAPSWPEELDGVMSLELDIIQLGDDTETSTPGEAWQGLGASGRLPRMESLSTRSAALVPLVKSEGGDTLAGYFDDGGYYPELAQAAGVEADYDGLDEGRQPVIVIVEPDLVNNYGFASPVSADVASQIIQLATAYDDVPITFDLTLNGLGASQNLLTLAFQPPFLAATLCLILAMFVIGWRAFRRFGPPVTEHRAIAFGKTRLIENSAGFVQRSKRPHLLSRPYADMVRNRIAKTLGLRHADDDAVAKAVMRRAPDAPNFADAANRLRNARTNQELLRAADTLRSIERTLDT